MLKENKVFAEKLNELFALVFTVRSLKGIPKLELLFMEDKSDNMDNSGIMGVLLFESRIYTSASLFWWGGGGANEHEDKANQINLLPILNFWKALANF